MRSVDHSPGSGVAARGSRIRRWERRAVAGLLRLLRQGGSRERIARGFALGLIVNFLPTFGFGVLISGFFARLLGGNLVAGLVGGGSLTLLWPVLFLANVRVGSLVVRPERVIDGLADVTSEAVSAMVWGRAFLVGSVINCVVVGTAIYLLMLALYRPLRPRALAGLRGRAASIRARSGPGPGRGPAGAGSATAVR